MHCVSSRFEDSPDTQPCLSGWAPATASPRCVGHTGRAVQASHAACQSCSAGCHSGGVSMTSQFRRLSMHCMITTILIGWQGGPQRARGCRPASRHTQAWAVRQGPACSQPGNLRRQVRGQPQNLSQQVPRRRHEQPAPQPSWQLQGVYARLVGMRLLSCSMRSPVSTMRTTTCRVCQHCQSRSEHDGFSLRYEADRSFEEGPF